MKVKGVPVKLGIHVHVPALDDELAQHFQHVAFINPSLTTTDLKAATLKRANSYRRPSFNCDSLIYVKCDFSLRSQLL